VVEAPADDPVLLVWSVNVAASLVELAGLWRGEAVDIEYFGVAGRFSDLVVGVGWLDIAVFFVLGVEIGLILAESLSSSSGFLLFKSHVSVWRPASIAREGEWGEDKGGNERVRLTSIFLNMRSLYSWPSRRLTATKNSFLVLLAARPGAIHSTQCSWSTWMRLWVGDDKSRVCVV